MKKTRKMIMYTRSTCFGTLGLSRWYSTQDNGKSSVNNNTTGVKGLEMSGVSTWSSGSLTNDGLGEMEYVKNDLVIAPERKLARLVKYSNKVYTNITTITEKLLLEKFKLLNQETTIELEVKEFTEHLLGAGSNTVLCENMGNKKFYLVYFKEIKVEINGAISKKVIMTIFDLIIGKVVTSIIIHNNLKKGFTTYTIANEIKRLVMSIKTNTPEVKVVIVSTYLSPMNGSMMKEELEYNEIELLLFRRVVLNDVLYISKINHYAKMLLSGNIKRSDLKETLRLYHLGVNGIDVSANIDFMLNNITFNYYLYTIANFNEGRIYPINKSIMNSAEFSTLLKQGYYRLVDDNITKFQLKIEEKEER